MTSLRDQEKLDGEVRPIIVNVCNFAKPADGEPALLTFDDARTLFHEFGHALHGLLSDVTYPFAAGTAVAARLRRAADRSSTSTGWRRRRSWRSTPATPRPASRCRRRCSTRLLATRNFNQGFATVEYTRLARWSTSTSTRGPAPSRLDVAALEKQTLDAHPACRPRSSMRHASPHFQHLFSGDGYSAGYYSYMWSEVLDADAFAAFKETGDVFDPATAKRLRDFIYSAGNLRDPEEAYKAFRGRLPAVDALLQKRGLADAMPAGDA